MYWLRAWDVQIQRQLDSVTKRQHERWSGSGYRRLDGMDKKKSIEKRVPTCQASSSCDSSSLRWMASNNWLFRDIMSFLLLTNSASIRFFLPRSDETSSVTSQWYIKNAMFKLTLAARVAFDKKTMNYTSIPLTVINWFLSLIFNPKFK